MQDLVHQSFERFGQLWPRDKILLKLMEECGELAQAFRKGDSLEQRHEFGDVLFALYALAEREHIGVDSILSEAVLRFEQYCNRLAKQRIEDLDAWKGQQLEQAAKFQPDLPHSTTYGEAERQQAAEPRKVCEADRKPLTADYPAYCRVCNFASVHKSSDTQVCPDCR
jgi:NTP pyrophosphatase (non-canonical NTP hydrolase)